MTRKLQHILGDDFSQSSIANSLPRAESTSDSLEAAFEWDRIRRSAAPSPELLSKEFQRQKTHPDSHELGVHFYQRLKAASCLGTEFWFLGLMYGFLGVPELPGIPMPFLGAPIRFPGTHIQVPGDGVLLGAQTSALQAKDLLIIATHVTTQSHASLSFSRHHRLDTFLASHPRTTLKMSDSQWLWDPLTICQMGPLRENKTCCGITKKGDACQLIVKKETLKEGRHKLDNLARSPFNLSTLDSQLSDLVSFFLCKKWHRVRQHDDIKQQWFDAAVRNQADAQISPRHRFPQITGVEIDVPQQVSASTVLESDELAPLWGVDEAFSRLPASTWLEVSRPPGRDVTLDMLTTDRVPWNVSSDDPAILSIHNEYGGVHYLHIHAVGQERCPD
ncbi:hypothetical protein PENARI_c175G11100, partial [Penicillium arizonense]